MASTKQQHMGEGGLSQISGMSKNQLHDIMSQMKTLIEQNQQQARKILIDNPSLTKSLFQAQIMLGMVRPPQKMPNIQQALSQQPQQSTQAGKQTNVQAPHLPPEPVLQGQTTSSQLQLPAKQQYPAQSSIPMPPSAHLPPIHTQLMSSHSAPPMQQAKSPLNTQVPSVSFPSTSQIHNLPLPPPTAMQHPLQSHLPMISKQAQHSIQSTGVLHQPLQPPLPPQPRPSSTQPFQHQLHSQGPHSIGFQPSGAPPQYPSQPMFHPNANLPTSFQQAQPPPPNQPPPQHLYMGGTHLGSDFGNQGPTPMQVDRGSPWIPGLSDSSNRAQFQGTPTLMPAQMGPGSGVPPPRPPQLTSEMEKALLQQVMSLTPDQISLLPPEQRQQVLQLQQILR